MTRRLHKNALALEKEGLESATRKLRTLALAKEGLESATRKLRTLALENEGLETQNACAFPGDASVDAASASIPLAPDRLFRGRDFRLC